MTIDNASIHNNFVNNKYTNEIKSFFSLFCTEIYLSLSNVLKTLYLHALTLTSQVDKPVDNYALGNVIGGAG